MPRGLSAKLAFLRCGALAAVAACGGAPSATRAVCPSTSPGLPRLAWIVAPDTTKVVSLEAETRDGYGADFVRDELDFVIGPSGDATGTSTRVTRGVAMSRSAPTARAVTALVPRALAAALLEAVAGARSRAPSDGKRVVVVASDVYRRWEVRIRDVDDVHHVAVFTAPSDRVDAVWHLRTDDAAASGELEPEALTHAFDALKPSLTAAAK